MKRGLQKLASIVATLLLTSIALAGSDLGPNGVASIVRASSMKSLPDGGGDDLFPWPWGSECPFPWQEIKGRYMVKSLGRGVLSGHMLEISVVQKDGSDLEFLEIQEFDRAGNLYAKGEGYAQPNERVVKGILNNERTERSSLVMIRTYVKDQKSECSARNLVTAVTFCPLRGRKCQSEPNYLLERM
jgi:hypothetical protein